MSSIVSRFSHTLGVCAASVLSAEAGSCTGADSSIPAARTPLMIRFHFMILLLFCIPFAARACGSFGIHFMKKMLTHSV